MRAAALLLMAGMAVASPIYLLSGVSSGESNNITGTNLVLPFLDPAWTPDSDGAKWISFENTGYGGIVLPNAIPGDPNAIFSQTFTDDAGTSLDVMLRVWADDTAAVYLDGLLLAPAMYTQAANCSPGPITCTGAGDLIDFTTTPGTHTLTFDVYQTGLVTYGLMYAGTVTSVGGTSPVPEPSSFWLLGGALMVIGLYKIVR